jgi:topoisomerase IA-like protein
MKQKKEYILGKYENEKLILKKGKFGLYVTWGKKSKSLSKLGNRPIENITLEEVEKYLS